MSQRVLVLGGTGMLGAMMVRVLREKEMDVTATRRDRWSMPEERCRHFDASHFVECPDPEVGDNGLGVISKADWIINCIGITKPVIDADLAKGRKTAIEVNALFPHLLARNLRSHQRLIQIATDCVFSGQQQGPASEETPHDALDVYGKTKSLGEVFLPNVMHLRTSIIGPEFRTEKRFLLEWFLGQAQDTNVPGYTNHYWNGITTLAFARICAGIIKNPGLFRAGVQHLVPATATSKMHLLAEMATAFGRMDINIAPKPADHTVNRVLDTDNPGFNRQLWQGAGYEHPSELSEMLMELASLVTDLTRTPA